MYNELTDNRSGWCLESICVAPASRDHRSVHAVADDDDVGLVLPDDDKLRVPTPLYMDDVLLVAVRRRGGDGSGHGGVVAAAICGHQRVGGLVRRHHHIATASTC